MSHLNDVIAYIRDARAVGISDEHSIRELRQAGWQDTDIRHAMGHTSTESGDIIEVRNLTKRYGAFTAVDDISFTVRRGETFGILGPNGAGKTTTLEMIEGLKPLSGGSIIVDGRDVSTQTREVKSTIGVQLQSATFFESLSLREILELFASIYGRTIDPMHLLAEVQLTDKAASQVKELSGGQKQRFSIAVGLVNEPTVLFLDEPTTGLDPQARRNLWDLVTQIKQRGTTIVITTHYMDEAEVLCDRIAIMDHAKVVALDTTRNLLNNLGVSSTIEFKSSAVIADESLRRMAGVESVFSENGTYFLTVTNPQPVLDQLFTMARGQGFGIEELTLKRATLEDVFLKLTGRQLRD